MPMSMRPSDAEIWALRSQAEHEGRSLQDVARQAIRDYVISRNCAELADDDADDRWPGGFEPTARPTY